MGVEDAMEGHARTGNRARRICHVLGGLAALLLAGGARGQETAAPHGPAMPPVTATKTREWKEGVEIRLRVPLATETHEVMCAVAFPESAIRSAVTGWGENTLTSVQKGNFLFLRLSKRAEGQLNVIGESG